MGFALFVRLFVARHSYRRRCSFAALKSRKRYLLKLFTVVLTIITVGEVLDAIVSRQNRHLMMAHRDGFVRVWLLKDGDGYYDY